MTVVTTPADHSAGTPATSPKRYRLPGIEREGIAQLSLLETALWPLKGGVLPGNAFETTYSYPTRAGRKTAAVTVRAPLGLLPIDEYVLWGLLGAALSFSDPDPELLATPYWMLRRLGLETGGSQYNELRESLLRLGTTSYQNTAFYDPETREHHYAAFQFLSLFLPTVGGIGETVDNDRSWRIEWNPAFLRFCRATGGNLLFDLDLYQKLSPAARRLFLKLKDRFWRTKRVFFNVDDLTIGGLGFTAGRPLFKRKFDLKNCVRELLEHEIIMLGRRQADVEQLFIRRGKGRYVVAFYEGNYFRQAQSERVLRKKNATADDPLYDPLLKIGVDGPGIRRLLKSDGRSLLQRWIRITEAAMHEKPRKFPGFRSSPAAFLIDGLQNNRQPPDWFHAHDKRQQYRRLKEERAALPPPDEESLKAYQQARRKALTEFLASANGQQQYTEARRAFLELYKRTDPHRAQECAHEAARQRIERVFFEFPEFEEWIRSQYRSA